MPDPISPVASPRAVTCPSSPPLPPSTKSMQIERQRSDDLSSLAGLGRDKSLPSLSLAPSLSTSSMSSLFTSPSNATPNITRTDSLRNLFGLPLLSPNDTFPMEPLAIGGNELDSTATPSSIATTSPSQQSDTPLGTQIMSNGHAPISQVRECTNHPCFTKCLQPAPNQPTVGDDLVPAMNTVETIIPQSDPPSLVKASSLEPTLSSSSSIEPTFSSLPLSSLDDKLKSNQTFKLPDDRSHLYGIPEPRRNSLPPQRTGSNGGIRHQRSSSHSQIPRSLPPQSAPPQTSPPPPPPLHPSPPQSSPPQSSHSLIHPSPPTQPAPSPHMIPSPSHTLNMTPTHSSSSPSQHFPYSPSPLSRMSSGSNSSPSYYRSLSGTQGTAQALSALPLSRQSSRTRSIHPNTRIMSPTHPTRTLDPSVGWGSMTSPTLANQLLTARTLRPRMASPPHDDITQLPSFSMDDSLVDYIDTQHTSPSMNMISRASPSYPPLSSPTHPIPPITKDKQLLHDQLQSSLQLRDPYHPNNYNYSYPYSYPYPPNSSPLQQSSSINNNITPEQTMHMLSLLKAMQNATNQPQSSQQYSAIMYHDETQQPSPDMNPSQITPPYPTRAHDQSRTSISSSSSARPSPYSTRSHSSSNSSSPLSSSSSISRTSYPRSTRARPLPSQPVYDDDDLITCGSYTRAERRAKIAKYRMKREHRRWNHTILYEVRKKFADSRRRVGGRFVKMGAEEKLQHKLQVKNEEEQHETSSSSSSSSGSNQTSPEQTYPPIPTAPLETEGIRERPSRTRHK